MCLYCLWMRIESKVAKVTFLTLLQSAMLFCMIFLCEKCYNQSGFEQSRRGDAEEERKNKWGRILLSCAFTITVSSIKHFPSYGWRGFGLFMFRWIKIDTTFW